MFPKARLIRVTHPLGIDEKTSKAASEIADAIMDALSDADAAGLVVEITLDPCVPLAQGSYTPHIRIRETKDAGMAREAWQRALDGAAALRAPLVGKLLPPEGL